VIGTRDVIASVSKRVYHRSRYVGGKVVVAAAGQLEHNAIVGLVERPSGGPRTLRRKGVRVRRPLVKPRRLPPSNTRV
jgi:hypothetical protein